MAQDMENRRYTNGRSLGGELFFMVAVKVTLKVKVTGKVKVVLNTDAAALAPPTFDL